MEDYRTWWRKGHETYKVLIKSHIGLADMFEPDEGSSMLFQPIKYSDRDLMAEQIWAIREGLA